MKKILSLVLAVTLFMGVTSTVFAKNDKDKKSNNGKSASVCKFFIDNYEVAWAQKAIDKLMLKGILKGFDNRYEPKRSVTQIEAIVMALRVMGWEDEAVAIKNLPKKYKGAYVQPWAVGYVTKAYEKGILDEVDLMYFNPSAPAKRHEVAKYVIRALQKDEEAKKYMNAKLPFVDAAAVPVGSVGYVYLVNELGIMKGDGKRFNPMGTLTRAEMAVLFYNLDERVDNDNDVEEYTGVVHEVKKDKITIKNGVLLKTFKVSEDVVVYKDTKKVAYSTIKKDDRVVLKTDDDVVEYIEILSKDQADNDKIITSYTGKLTAIGNGNPVTLTVDIKDLTAIFKLADGAEFYFKNVKGTVNDLKIGDEVKIAVDNTNRALKVVVDRELPVITEDKGKITAIDLVGTYHLTVDDVRYELSKNAEVKVDNKPAELDDLEIGMDVVVKVDNGVVVKVYAES